MTEFIPSNFKVPELLQTDSFRLRMLTIHDLEKDYDAVMSSIDHLKGVFGPKSTWPKNDLSKEQDLIDLGWHQKEFQKRSSFAYTVVSLYTSHYEMRLLCYTYGIQKLNDNQRYDLAMVIRTAKKKGEALRAQAVLLVNEGAAKERITAFTG